MKVLAEIPARSLAELGAGTLRRRDLEAFGRLLEELSGAGTVLITGAGPGRRSVATGLAAAAAAAGTRTALLESDLAEPVLADALGLANAPGLHEYLRGAADSEQILSPVVLAGPGSARATEPLVCVVAGRPSREGSRLLGSDAFARALSGLSAAYELVVLAGPGLEDPGAVSLLGAHADATVACLDDATDFHGELPLPVTGVVVHG